MNRGRNIVRLLLLLSSLLLPPLCLAATIDAPPHKDFDPNKPIPTTILVRVVAHGAMVLGKDVGGARVTITDVASGEVLATGIQYGEAGDQNQIMRTPRMIDEPQYSTRASASFTTTLSLTHPILVDIAAEGPLAYPAAAQRAHQRMWLIPGENMTDDGIVLHLHGYLVRIEQPRPRVALIAKDDVTLRASVRTLSGSLVRPHGDWDSRKIRIYGEVLIGDRILERLQMFYDEESRTFEAPFFVPPSKEAPDGITLRVIATDRTTGNSGMDQVRYPVLSERLPPTRQ
jgi:hypothetical protein